MEETWEIVDECNDDLGNPTEYALKISKGKWCWIDMNSNNQYDVIAPDGKTVLVTLKSLSSAKRWVHQNFKF